ncbi:MAG TPA: DUF1549 and DUF1553 domain-containing protein [Gemmataceae bacterium]|nr:DUF1549 and DUF1553 domain-containing protein [Gemmataceae bacterium]
MRCVRLGLVGLGLLAAAGASPSVRAGDPAANASPALSAERLADRIDELIEAKWREHNVQPAPLADDAQFLRRLSLDVGGRIPAVQDVRQFLADKSADKRHKAVDALLASPLYSTHFAAVWRSLMVPDSNNPFVQGTGPQLEAWLKNRLRENAHYDKMVREILTTPVVVSRAAMQGRNAGEPTPLPFYQAQEMKPENLAAATSRLFLGVKLECAQCHNHPFAKWKREQFWEYAAFFSGIQAPAGQGGMAMAINDLADRREIKITGTDKVVQARFLDHSEPKWQRGTGTRQTLADWLTSPDNSYFARAAANRMWAHFFGLGIVEPVDEESEENPPSHPELLDELARQFVLHDFDMKYLIRAITYSKAYQRSSESESAAVPDPRLFARMAIKGLTAEQLYDSIVEATRYKEPPPVADPRGVAFGQLAGARAEFVSRFSNHSDKRTEFQTSILQALALMNGKFVSDATSLDVHRSETLSGVIDAPWMKTADKIEALYLAALSRKPRPEESARLVKYVERGGPSGDKNKALADVFWALLNSSEFILNH